jgi:hypothetical protein
MEMDEDLRKIIADHEKRIVQLEKLLAEERKPRESGQDATIDNAGIKRLAEKIKVPEEKIREIFDLEQDSLTLVGVTGKDDREKTKNVALLVLLGYKYFLGVENVLAQVIRTNVGGLRVPLDNFGTYLKDITPRFVIKKGKPRSPKTTYKLTVLGEAEAKELLIKLCEVQNG